MREQAFALYLTVPRAGTSTGRQTYRIYGQRLPHLADITAHCLYIALPNILTLRNRYKMYGNTCNFKCGFPELHFFATFPPLCENNF